ncbi:MAG: serine/threonine-protein kinase [Proteobacteria bacterium]|nr:serine/threonine-protein kinase [Pseudomonadota bacterium]
MGSALRRCVICHVSYPGTERFCPIDGGAVVEVAADQAGARVGQLIDGRYLVRRLLGRGGMGEVYEADHTGLDKRVAIKFVMSDAVTATAIARFRREARVASKVVHEHVVHIYDVGRAGDVDYIVMEYLEGKDLRETLLAEGRMMPARATSIALQMLDGLAAVHAAGILHRDIKPANVLLAKRRDDGDLVKIMDFGISKSIDEATEHGAQLTGTGNVIGTPDYIAPEVLRGEKADPRADLYAVGITLWQMLVGRTPFHELPFERVIAMHLHEEPKRVDAIRSDVSPGLADLVVRAIAKAPDARFATADAFADALRAESEEVIPLVTPIARAPTVPPALPPTAPTVHARPLWPWALAIAALLVGGGIGIAVYVTREESVVSPVRDAAVDARVDAPIDAGIDAPIDGAMDAVDAPIDAVQFDYRGRPI